mmetsp:Transcript_145204/g.404666  ORF Transcript_145204/g.404666 Transcript_145204/m.404666 type:complete len:572 (-) Transcript_145204:50-1765(-)
MAGREEEEVDGPALHAAARADDACRVSALLAVGADPLGTAGPFRWTALHEASGHGALKASELLLAAGISVDVRASDGETPLHLAAQQGHEAQIRLLLAARADPNLASEEGETPLHTAVQHVGSKGLEHVAALLELRADPTAKDGQGLDAVGCARIYTNRAAELEAALHATAGGNACAGAGTGIAGSMLAAPVAPVARPEAPEVLHQACRRGEAACVRQLLAWLPGPAVPAAAQGALVAAAAGGSVEVLEALAGACADVCSVAIDHRSGMIPLVAAAEECALKAVRWLLMQRADACATSRDGATALMASSLRGHREAVEVLLAARGALDHAAHGGWTALMVASQAGKSGVVRLLLDARAQLQLANSDGTTARDLAVANGHHEIVKIVDIHAKLSTRREKASAKAGSCAASPAVEDTRDLDALLADLGEPRAARGRAKRQPPKAAPLASALTAAPQSAADARDGAHWAAGAADATSSDTAAAVAPATTAGASDSTQGVAAPAAEAPGHAKTKKCKAKKTADGDKAKSEPSSKAPAGVDRLCTLRGRLEELVQLRAKIDAEEAEILKEIMRLEG